MEVSTAKDLKSLMTCKDGDNMSFILQWVKILSNIYSNDRASYKELLPIAQANWREVFKTLPRVKYCGQSTGISLPSDNARLGPIMNDWGLLEESIAVKIGWATTGLGDGRVEVQVAVPNSKAAPDLELYGYACLTNSIKSSNHKDNSMCLKLLNSEESSWVKPDNNSLSLAAEDERRLHAEIVKLFHANISTRYPRSLLKHLGVLCELDGQLVSKAFKLLKKASTEPPNNLWPIKDWAPLCRQGEVEGGQEIYYEGAWRRCDTILLLKDDAVYAPLSERRAIIKPESRYFEVKIPEDSSLLSTVHESWGFLVPGKYSRSRAEILF
jgi:hypothetical protein